jgi:hypothetical protein
MEVTTNYLRPRQFVLVLVIAAGQTRLGRNTSQLSLDTAQLDGLRADDMKFQPGLSHLLSNWS